MRPRYFVLTLAPIIYLNQLKNGLFLVQFSNIENEKKQKLTANKQWDPNFIHYDFISWFLFYGRWYDSTVWFSMCHCCFSLDMCEIISTLKICRVTDGTLD